LLTLIPIILSYLIGSISFSYLVVKWTKGTDVRQYGSGNAGATNTLRVLGWGPALLVLALDIGKGILAVALGQAMSAGHTWVPIVCGAMVIVGHNWPVFFGFRGGKGVATMIGVTAMLAFWPSLMLSALAILVIALTRYVSVGSLTYALLFPIVVWWLDRPVELVWFGLFVFVMTWFKHRSNLVKLWRGTENKIGQKWQGGDVDGSA
jgi:glycerol-3-phosphate acyltransferase PlsY